MRLARARCSARTGQDSESNSDENGAVGRIERVSFGRSDHRVLTDGQHGVRQPHAAQRAFSPCQVCGIMFRRFGFDADTLRKRGAAQDRPSYLGSSSPLTSVGSLAKGHPLDERDAGRGQAPMGR